MVSRLSYWFFVLAVYILNICLWAGLFGYFVKQFKVSTGELRSPFLFMVMASLFLTVQEIYFFLTVATNPGQAAVLPARWYPGVLKIWIGPKILLTVIALSLIAMLWRERSSLSRAFRHISLDLGIFRGLREGLERMYQPRAVSLMLYRAGKEAGGIFAKKVAEKGFAGKELFNKVVEATTSSGWANKIETASFEPKKKAVIRLRGSFESVERKSTEPACDFQRGFWAGLLQHLEPDMVCHGKESLCEAKGDPYCEFQINFFEKPKPM